MTQETEQLSKQNAGLQVGPGSLPTWRCIASLSVCAYISYVCRHHKPVRRYVCVCVCVCIYIYNIYIYIYIWIDIDRKIDR